MKNNTYELMIHVKDILEANGYEVTSSKLSNLRDFEHQGHASKDGKSWRTPVEGYNFTHLNGYEIGFYVVHRSNATNENVSVDVVIYRWRKSSGGCIAKERTNIKMSDKSINNRVQKIMDAYENLVVDKEEWN